MGTGGKRRNERVALRWRTVSVQAREPLCDIDMDGTTALHVTVLVGDLPIGRTIVPCRSTVCSAQRLAIHLAPFTAPAAAAELRHRFDRPDDELNPDVPVSIVVCTRNRADHLDRCLASIVRSTGVDAQVVVVDNGNDEGRTAEVADRHGVERIVESIPGLDRARNRGLTAVRHDIVLFTDDDVEVDPSWAMRLAQGFDDPIVAAVTGLILPAQLESDGQIEFEMLAGFIRTFDAFTLDGSTTSPTSAGRAGAGASMAFRRDFLFEIGGFPEVLDAGRPTQSGGDTWALYRVLRAGLRIRFEPRAIALHSHRTSRADGAAAVEGYASGVVSYLLHGAIVCRDPSAVFAATKWTAWRIGLLLRESIRNPRSTRNSYVGRQVLGAVKAPRALVRAIRTNPAPPIDLSATRPPRRPKAFVPPLIRPQHQHEPEISVVIPTQGRRPELAELVVALRAQTESVEIIVSVDGGFQSPEDFRRRFGAHLDARVIIGPGDGAGSARNVGTAAANSDVVLFLDDDVMAENEHLVANHLRRHRDGHDVVIGAVRPVTTPRPTSLEMRERNWWADHASRIDNGHALGFTDVCSGNMSITRSVFESVGGFRAFPRREDYEIGLRLLEAGHDVVGAADAAVLHPTALSGRDAFERRQREGRADAMLAEDYPTNIGQLHLGSWPDLGSRRRRVMRLALEHPASAVQLAALGADLCRLLGLVGSRRRRANLHDIASETSYWAGVGEHAGGAAGWERMAASVDEANELATRPVLDVRQAATWVPEPLGTHCVDVTLDGTTVGSANLRWGGLPFDRNAFAKRLADRVGLAAVNGERP